MIFCARATRGRGLPLLGIMARPGKSIAKQSEGRAGEKYLPVGGRAKKLRAVEDQSALVPEDFISVAHGTDLAGHFLYGSCLSRVGIGSLSGGVTKPSAS